MRSVLLAVMVASPLAGQAVPSFDSETWIRYSTALEGNAPRWVLARVEALTPQYLVVEPLGQSMLAVTRGALTEVERFEGWVSRRRRGSLWGAVVGIGVGVGLSFVADCWPYCLAIAPLGTYVGYRMGNAATGNRWRSVPLHRLDEAFAPRRVARVGWSVAVGWR